MFLAFEFILSISCYRKVPRINDPIQIDKEKPNVVIPPLPAFLKKMNPTDTNIANIPILFSFEKTACFGFCPVYKFTLYANGVACYLGKNYVKKEGTLYGLFNENDWNVIKMKVDSIQYFKLASVYPIETNQSIPDLAKTISYFKLNGKEKKIENSYSAPIELRNFEEYLVVKINEFVERHLD